MLKKFLLLILLMPLLAKGQSTTTPLPTSTAYTPQFRYTSTAADTLKQIWVYSGSKYNRWYTATEINRYFAPKSDSTKYIWNATLTGNIPQNAFIYLNNGTGALKIGTDESGYSSYLGEQALQIFDYVGNHQLGLNGGGINFTNVDGEAYFDINTSVTDTVKIKSDLKPIKFTSKIQSSHTPTEGMDLLRKMDVPDSTTISTTYVPKTRSISTGTGLTGGGDLSANRTLKADTATLQTVANLFPKSDKRYIKKNSILINVKDFGVTGNGTTNDRDSLQKAINYQHSIQGSALYFPNGTYKYSYRNQPIPKASWGSFAARDSVDYGLVVYDNTHFIGENRDSTILKLDTASISVAITHNTTRSSYAIESYLDFASNMTFENMTFDGSKLNSTTYSEMDLLSINGNNNRVLNANVINSTGDNIDSDQGDYLLVDNCYLAGANKSAVNMAPDTYRLISGIVNNCVITGNYEGVVSRAELVTVTENRFIDNQQADVNINNNGATQAGYIERTLNIGNNKFKSTINKPYFIYWSRNPIRETVNLHKNTFTQTQTTKFPVFQIDNFSNAGKRILNMSYNSVYRGSAFLNSVITNATALRVNATNNTLDSLTTPYVVGSAGHLAVNEGDIVDITPASYIVHAAQTTTANRILLSSTVAGSFTTASTIPSNVLATTQANTVTNTTIATTAFSGTLLRLTGSGTGAATTISIPHGLTGVTSSSIALVTPINAASAGISYVTTDATNINIVYSAAPVSGTNNLSYNVHIKP